MGILNLKTRTYQKLLFSRNNNSLHQKIPSNHANCTITIQLYLLLYNHLVNLIDQLFSTTNFLDLKGLSVFIQFT